MASSLLAQPVVIDNGTGVVKAGMAGGDRPTAVFEAVVGRPKHVRMMPGGALEGSDVVVGRRAVRHRGALVLRRPMARGQVDDWGDVERVWAHAYGADEGLGIASDAHPLLLTEAPLNAAAHRERCAEVLFDRFNVPALFLAPQAILSLYASGRTTGLVLDVGDGVSHAVPVYEGFAIAHAATRMDVAGRDVTERLGLLLRRAGRAFSTSAERDVVREIKERRCYVARDPAADERAFAGLSSSSLAGGPGSTVSSSSSKNARAERDDPRVPPPAGDTNPQHHGESPQTTVPNLAEPAAALHELPDGSRLRLGPERFRAPEVLFDPSLVGSEDGGLARVVDVAARRADLDLRATLYAQIVLAGGSTMFPGFGDRLLHDLRLVSPPHTKLRIHAPPERMLSTWIGGSILASLATFKTMWVLRSEYEEHGARLFSSRALA